MPPNNAKLCECHKWKRWPAVELVRILLSSLVEVEGEICVNADAKVVVHDKDWRRVFVGLSRVGVVR